MEYSLIQRVKFAKINVYKNYCPIKDRQNPMDTLNGFTDYDMFGLKQKDIVISIHKRHKNKKTKYFHADKNVGENLLLKAVKIGKENSFYTDKEKHIINHYGNPFSNIKIVIWEKSIKIQNNKVYIRFYSYSKERNVNSIYFKKSTNAKSFTFDLSTGNFTVGDVGKTARFRKNSFSELKSFSEGRIFNVQPYSDIEHGKILPFLDEFDDVEFSNKINRIFNFEDCNYSKKPYKFLENITKKFVEIKQIKVPNNYTELLYGLYPGQKFLNKNEKKLIASILDYFGIKSKITIKLLHKSVNIEFLVRICYLLGNDFSKYVGSIDEKIFLTKSKGHAFTKEGLISLKKHNFYLTNIEKENLVKVLNSLVYSSEMKIEHFMVDVYDHFKMINMIREYDPTIYLKSKTIEDYNLEHRELSKMISAIRKGWVIEYVFNEKVVKDIEEPINVEIQVNEDRTENIKFYPHILKREEEYIEEGDFMHHCVASYSDKDKSMIVSIRTEDSSDRITCEFDCQRGLCIQSRHFCNAEPPGDMVLALEKLKVKIKYYSSLGLLHASEKRKVPLIINGVEITPEIKRAHELFPEYFLPI